MWWPAIGGVVVGVGGLIFPRALGVGYDVIGELLQGNAPVTLFVGILLVKSIIWIAALGSGTSGGVLAPVLMIGGALGGAGGIDFPSQRGWILADGQHGRRIGGHCGSSRLRRLSLRSNSRAISTW